MVRLGIWFFAVAYVGLSSVSDYYAVDLDHYVILFSAYLVIFLGIVFSVMRRLEWSARRYFTLVVDISATSFAIFLTNDATSPFYCMTTSMTRYRKSSAAISTACGKC